MTRDVRPRPRFSWLRVRVGIYVLVLAAILLFRFGPVRDSLYRPIPGVENSGDTLVVAGSGSAPALVARIVAGFRSDYPRVPVRLVGGATAHGLEALGNREADAAFLLRPPSTEEQAALTAALGDSVLWFPVGLGGLMLLLGSDPPVDSLDVPALRAFVSGARPGPFSRLYAADPNRGLWDAFLVAVGAPALPLPPGPHVVFLADDDAVREAVAADPGAVGLVSTLDYDEDPERLGIAVLRVAPDPDAAAAEPTYRAVGIGAYPLHHSLVVASRARGGILGSMFVTWVVSDRGQRWIERGGQLPARLPLREVVLSRRAVGAAG